MTWTGQSFSVGQILTAAQMNNLQADITAHANGDPVVDSGSPAQKWLSMYSTVESGSASLNGSTQYLPEGLYIIAGKLDTATTGSVRYTVVNSLHEMVNFSASEFRGIELWAPNSGDIQLQAGGGVADFYWSRYV